tara:strand:+ start:30 stop:239 length:210 start_codon:yes stop_codon:yes gene_type:complete
MIVENNKDPIAPEIVFLGLIFVNLGPLKYFPNMKPPISDATHAIIKENKIISSCLKFDNKKNKKVKVKI